MKRLVIFLTFAFCLSINVSAKVSIDSTTKQRFQALAKKMHLKTPKLDEGEYEVRIWNKQALLYGDAHILYTLNKTDKRLCVSKYVIDSDSRGFKYAVQLKPNRPVADTLWEKLVKQDILTLPDELAIVNKLHPPRKDSTWNVIEGDGNVSVHAKRVEPSGYYSDGEDYYFEVFRAGGYRSYVYSNPRDYSKDKPNIVELQKVVTILNTLAVLFRSSN